ncbi:MAG: acetyl-CoA carboxylase biotin carboxylase subunit [Bacteroidetes bacterium]|nr:acetyl-CoA carboxylase biotin carboxylase subunit [Bacteroidota bacterium]
MKKILVANRGEIALRIMKTIRKMGLKCVAVYSDADRNAPHVLYADESVCIGKGPSSQSYLNAEKIIEVSKTLNVDGIHPGYGFLSENAGFAKKVIDSGIIFIGPSAESMRIMGSKLAAKDAVKKFDVPMVPGIDTAITDIETAKIRAKEIGYPILIKASAGGGGKGMRTVENEVDFEEQMNRAVSEATSSFGDGSVFIEKYVSKPRHIEVQVLADLHGNCVHIFERECSIQRRHQKVIEEAPSSILTPALRKKMGEAAVLVAKSCNYTGAGTVEFLVDDSMNFYFLEMNTRLQVEHPVTEMISGLDLVEQQINVAMGKPLNFTQEDLQIKGHAIELRVYAEDPFDNFLPSIGTLLKYEEPKMANIRIDSGYTQGMTIPVFYDPMISKLIAYGKDRHEAVSNLKEAIKNYKIEGVATTLPFGTFVLNNEEFLTGNFDTSFVSKHFKNQDKNNEEGEAIALGALAIWLQNINEVKLPTETITKL